MYASFIYTYLWVLGNISLSFLAFNGVLPYNVTKTGQNCCEIFQFLVERYVVFVPPLAV